jgi:prenyltransferase beta subunit
MKLEGGFQGRTNKLVDACYSFWQGAAMAILNIIRNGGTDIDDMEIYLTSSKAATHVSQVMCWRTCDVCILIVFSST